MKDLYDRMEAKRKWRIDRLASWGIKANTGPFVGHINLSAGETAKLIKLLRRLKLTEVQRGEKTD